jgi:sigma-B regulation protein RsbU (phosphoserine phosphatase)
VEARAELAPGDLLFFYTDGLVESENDAGDMFGSERLQAILSATQADAIDQMLRDVEAEVKAFRGKIEPFDDATMMALRIAG